MRLIYWIDSILWVIYTNRKIRLAKRLFKISGKQHHVIPFKTKKGIRLKVVYNAFIDEHNRLASKCKPKQKNIDINDLLRMAVYSTGCKLK